MKRKTNYVITITTTDDGDSSWTQNFIITIENTNDAPTAITLSNDTINENVAIGTLIGTLTTMDEDDPLGNGTYTYTLGDTHKDTFEILGNELKTKIPLNYEEKSSYTIQITTDDGQGGIYDTTFVISVKDVNDAPTAISLSNDTINENVAIGTLIGTLTTIDEDQNENHRYELSGMDSASFRIAENNRLETHAPFDYETKTNYVITITTTDDGDSSWTQSFTITIKDVNEKPTKIILSNNIIAKNSDVGTLIGILSTMDPDNNDSYVYTINAPLSDTFQIVDDQLKTKIFLNHEIKLSYTISITTQDNGGNTLTENFIITIDNTNSAPTAIALSNDTINENTAIGTVIGILSSIDPDDIGNDNEYNYTINGPPSDTFQIVGDTLKTKMPLNYEEKSSYTIQIITNDGQGGIYDTTFVISVKDVNDAPTAITLSNDTINENVAIGTLVGTLTTMDEDDPLMNGTYTYTLGDTHKDTFEILGNELKTKIPLNYETKSSYVIQITTDDGQGGIYNTTFVISVKDVNDAPTAISLSNDTINENVAIGTLIGTLTTIDEDQNENHRYELSGMDSASFRIAENNRLETHAPFDYETKTNYVITITTTDNGDSSWTQNFIITIENTNDAPTAITLSKDSIDENVAIGTLVGTLTTMDEDDPLGNGTYTYTLGDTHKDTFEILGNELKTKIPLNYEEQSSYTIQITTDDGQGGIYNTTFVISVKDVNDAPTAISLSNDTINENVAIGTLIGTLTTIDEDQNENHRYELSGMDSASFRIAENNRLETHAPFDYETKTNYVITITTTDDGDSSWTQNFIITIENTNDAPTAITLSNDTINENMPIGTLVGTLTTMDEDDPLGNGTYTYTLGDTHKDTFEILGNELKTKIPLNYEEQSSYTIQITTDDGQGGIYNTTFVISVKDVNDAPTAISLSNDTINENVAIGTLIGTLTTIDEDQNENHRYELSGMDSASFRIAENNRLETHAPFDYETKTNYVITITTTDDGDSSWTQNFIITIENTNDAPTDITLSNDTINENVAIGTLIGTLTTMDEDDPLMNGTYTYTLGDTHKDTFEILGNELKTKIPLNYEEQSSYTIQITTDDGQGGIYDSTFVISVKDVNDAPTAITLSNDTINENVAIGTLIGTLTTIDEDQNENHRYELSGMDSASFRIAENNRLETHVLFDYETKTNYVNHYHYTTEQ